MGEVYRADDLTLDHPVALKFLPEDAASNPASLAQFHNELRVARHVSHKNVCRLYDLGEAEGRRFLTMEYVDGEDLASLIRRIGRIQHDKAVDIARRYMPEGTLNFQVDFKWTLSDLEIRVATLQCTGI